jgi:alkanesulfonate monooxygenase SsuD/methylene tetrahydromethanopterin reductase-like flavin-dependent oxidoreductase (luciferase family)
VATRWICFEHLELASGPSWPTPLAALIERSGGLGFDVVIVGGLVHEAQQLDTLAALGAVASSAAVRIGALGALGDGRPASMMARETTTLDHLSLGGAALLVRCADPMRLAQGAAVITSLFTQDRATAGGALEHVQDAPNNPRPATRGGPPLMTWDLGTGTGQLLSAGERSDAAIIMVETLEQAAREPAPPSSLTVVSGQITLGEPSEG